MLSYDKIKNKKRLFQCFTGLTIKAFLHLLPAFCRAYAQASAQQDKQRDTPRQRQRGGGRKATLLEAADKLLFILFYFKFYPIQEVQGFLFGLSQSQANEWIHRLTPVLNQALGYEKQLPVRKAHQIEVLATCPGLEFIIDGAERPIQRPQDEQKQKDCYSGKKKRHTKKNVLITDKRTKKVKVLGQTQPGKSARQDDHRRGGVPFSGR